MKKLKAYQVGCLHGCDDRIYCNLVFAHTNAEARKISQCDSGETKYRDFRAARIPEMDRFLNPAADKAYAVTDLAIMREAGWRCDGDEQCELCELYSMDSAEYDVCDECFQCKVCGHDKGCSQYPGEG